MPSDDVVLKYGDEAMKTIDGRYSLFKKIYGGSARRTGWFLNAKVYGDQPAHFGLPGQPVGVQGQPVGVPAQPVGVPGQPVGVPGQPVGVPAQPVPVRYPGQNIGLQGQLPGQPAVVPGGAPAQPAVLPVQPGIPPGQPAGQPVQVPGNQALGAPGQPPGQAAGVPGQAAGVPGQVAGAPAQPRDPTNENGGLGENPFNKVPEGGAAQPAEDNQGEAATEDVVPSSRNVTMPETRLVIFSAVPKCGSATTAKLFKTWVSCALLGFLQTQTNIHARMQTHTHKFLSILKKSKYAQRSSCQWIKI